MKYAYKGREIRPMVEIYHDVVPYLGGITEGEFYRDAEKCAAAWKKANAAISDCFGELLPPRAPSAAPLSYGHLVSIGAQVNLPEDSEPNIRPFVNSLEEGIALLKDCRGIDFFDNPTAKHYIEVNEYLQSQFPEYQIAPLAGYGVEGIITTAELMRGQDFFMDLYDDPELTHEFLTLLNENLIAFNRAQRVRNGLSEMNPAGGAIADDFASLIPPDLWPEFVIPYWNQFYAGVGEGTYHWLHCENTHPSQLRYLKDAGITHYQPSVADQLTLENVRANTDVSFDWLLYAYRIVDMTDDQIQAWVDETVRAGVSRIRTQFGKYTWSAGKMDRILAFFKAFEKYRID